MINIVFLLLIFFMVAGTIRQPDPLPVDAPMSRSGAEQTARPVLYLDATGAMMLNETAVPQGRLTDELRAMQATSPRGIVNEDKLNLSAADSAVASADPVLAIKADAATPVVLLRQVLTDARLAGIHSIELITLQDLESP
ncbi:ExbD/TolR family protein [Granulosicoccus sp. 3-233]|uniref:ExbD/TolR family protein n=1 Tax=Granulosicoccus sp. 3-233 TaxID=3417969 RepID=UPI003D34EF89